MCGRAALTANPDDLREAFGLDELPPVSPHYNVPPSQPLAVLRTRAQGRRAIELLRWGLVPRWARDAKPSHKLALARSENIMASSAFRDAVRRRRCLVIIDGFFEWRREPSGHKTPFFVRRPGGEPFTLAGVWERWASRDGEVIESCAIVTQPSRPPVAAIHDRMPVVLERDEWDRWLDPASGEDQALQAMLEPHEPLLVAYSVGSVVNDPRNDDARCLVPAHPVQLTLVQ